MSHTPTSTTDRSFFTREKGMLFTIQLKAMIHFQDTGIDRKPLTYTVVGNDEEVRRRISISIHGPSLYRNPVIKVVTVLHSKESRHRSM